MPLSTSSSDAAQLFAPSPEEQAPISTIPKGALLFIVLVVVSECFWRLMLPWYADLAAWQWRVKRDLIAEGSLDGDLALVGTSVLFHAMDARLINAYLARQTTGRNRPPRVVNLALNGMSLQHQTQLLERYVAAGKTVPEIALELRAVEVKRESWMIGPYWQFWATPSELLQSGALWLEPSLLVPFLSNRLVWSLPYSQSLDRWLFALGRQDGLASQVYHRNRAVQHEMRDHLGFTPGTFLHGLTPAALTPDMRQKTQSWVVTVAGEYWLTRLLARAASQGIRVTIFQPPAPPFVVERRLQDDFDRQFDAYVASLRGRYPTLGLPVFYPQGYTLDDFADMHHLSVKGAKRLSEEFAAWVAQHCCLKSLSP